MNNITLQNLKNIISTKKKILIISHYNPDGDAIGSSFGLANYLNSNGIEAHVYNRDQTPEYLSFLSTKNFHNCMDDIPNNIDLYIILDFNDFERSGDDMMLHLLEVQSKNKNPIIVIDHHENSKINVESMLIDSKAASTGVILYRLLSEFENQIDFEVATCLMTTIITDTSSFKNSNSNIESFKVSTALLELGANLDLINKNIFKLGTINKLKLRSKIHSTLILDSNLKLAICYADKSFYNETNTTKEDSEGIPNGLILYDNVEIGIFIRQIGKDAWKVSTRTNNYIDLSAFCNIFGGGGHKNAAGFSYEGILENLIEEIVITLKK